MSERIPDHLPQIAAPVSLATERKPDDRLKIHWLLRDCRAQRKYARDWDGNKRSSVFARSNPSPKGALRAFQYELLRLRNARVEDAA